MSTGDDGGGGGGEKRPLDEDAEDGVKKVKLDDKVDDDDEVIQVDNMESCCDQGVCKMLSASDENDNECTSECDDEDKEECDEEEDDGDYDDPNESFDWDECCDTDHKSGIEHHETLPFPYQSMTIEEVTIIMDKIVEEIGQNINELLGVQLPVHIIRSIAKKYGWKAENIFEPIAEENGLEKILEDLKIDIPIGDEKDQIIHDDGFEETQGMEECGICTLEFIPEDMYSLECRHKFCTGCWTNYLNHSILTESIGEELHCPAYRCGVCVSDDFVQLFTSQEVMGRWKYLRAKNFLDLSAKFKLCPAPNCSRIIKVERVDWRGVTCPCGGYFCYQCGERWHSPITCEMMKKWNAKKKDDNQSNVWLKANTKECPKCKTAIQKNGGCNHMTCRKCNYHFCWICLQDWNVHGYNGGCIGPNQEKEMEQKSAEGILQRYNFFNNLYLNHQVSLEYENVARTTLEKHKATWEERGVPVADLRFIDSASNILRETRLVIMHSMIFSYFQTECNQEVMFRRNLFMLQDSVENLSFDLSQWVEVEDLPAFRAKIQKISSFCSERCSVLKEHVYTTEWPSEKNN